MRAATDSERIQAITRVERECLRRLFERFGDKNSGGEQWMPFHNVDHSLGYRAIAIPIGKQLVATRQLTVRRAALLPLGAASHDLVRNRGYGANEVASREEVIELMNHERAITLDDANDVGEMIMATRVVFEPGKIIQLTDPADPLLMGSADADLGAFGKASSLSWAIRWFAEMQIADGKIQASSFDELVRCQPDMDEFRAYLKDQRDLVANHRFHLPESRATLGRKQKANARMVDMALHMLDRKESFGHVLQFAEGLVMLQQHVAALPDTIAR